LQSDRFFVQSGRNRTLPLEQKQNVWGNSVSYRCPTSGVLEYLGLYCAIHSRGTKLKMHVGADTRSNENCRAKLRQHLSHVISQDNLEAWLTLHSSLIS